MAEEKKIEDVGVASPNSGKNPLLVILVLVNTIVVGAIGFFQFQNHKKLNALPTVVDLLNQQMASEAGGHGAAAGGEHGEKKTEGGHGEAAGGHGGEHAEEGILYQLEPFTANLAKGDGPSRYIRLSIVLKFNKDTKKEEVDGRKPQISDSILSLLNAKKPEDLLKAEGKNFLKEEIKNSINSFMVDGQVIDIFYVAFQIN